MESTETEDEHCRTKRQSGMQRDTCCFEQLHEMGDHELLVVHGDLISC